MWRRGGHGVARTVVALTTALLVACIATGCLGAQPKHGPDEKESYAMARQIGAQLAKRPDVVKAEGFYQNTLDAYQLGHFEITVKPGAPLQPVLDEAVRLVWLSKISPLGTLTIDVSDEKRPQRAITREFDLFEKKQSAQLKTRYGPRPT
jgi:hypothetical protein